MRTIPFIDSTSILTLGICTFNSEKNLGICLNFLSLQQSINIKEVIIADGGSTDKTLEIAQQYGCTIFNNAERINKFGKKLIILNTETEYLCLLDSDNFLTDSLYLNKMLKLIESNHNCIGVDSLFYHKPKLFSLLDFYLAQIGADDPLASFFGYYDRFSLFENNWTGSKNVRVISSEKEGFFFKYEKITEIKLPVPIGANGTIIKLSPFKEQQKKNVSDGFEHVIHCNELLCSKTKSDVVWGKCNVGLVHNHGTTIFVFFKKKLRRYLRRSSERSFRPSINDVLERVIPFFENLFTSEMAIHYKLLHILMIFLSVLTLITGQIYKKLFGFNEKSLDV